MNNNSLENLKREYLKTEIPVYLKFHGWDDISQKLSQTEEKKLFMKPAFALAFAMVVLLAFTSTLVFASQPTKPGDKLYQVKILSDKVYSEITGDYQTAIDKRAQEIIELKDEPNGRFDKAADEYQQILEKARDNTNNSDENGKKELRQNLEEQERKFQEISKESKNENKFRDVVEQTRKTRGEVKGAKDDKSNHRDSEDNDKNKQENKNSNDNSDRNEDD